MFKQNLFRSMRCMSVILLLNGFMMSAPPAQANIPFSPPQRQLDQANHLPDGLTADNWSQIQALIERQDELATVSSLTADKWSQQAYAKASNTDAEDEFGWSVAVSGDTVVVGAPYESSNATGVNGDPNNNSASFAGAAYVFVRSGTIWSQQAYVKASNTDGGDFLGWSVAVSGDTAVVGASHEASNATGVNGNQHDNSVTSAGAAYLYAFGPVIEVYLPVAIRN